MASRHLKTTMSLLFSEEFGVSTISKTLTFEIFWDAQNFLKVFLPVRSVGFCLRAWPLHRGSRGQTPLHWAARNGHVSVVQRLLEAKAAVDATDNSGRGLGRRIWGGKTFLRQWDLHVRKWMKCWSVDGLCVLVEIVFAKFWWCTRINMCCSFCSCDWFVSYTSMGCKEIGLWSWTLFYRRFQLANRLHAHHNPKNVPSVLRVSTLMTLM